MQAAVRSPSTSKAISGSLSASLLSCMKYGVVAPTGFQSKIFPTEKMTCAGREETIVRGGRHLFPLLPKAFDGIKQIGVVGWGSQGPAQAQNLRESLEGTGIKVKVGLRPGSQSFALAESKDFKTSNDTLGPMFDVIHESDLTILLISDAAMAQEYKKVFDALRPNTYLGLSHGFLLGHLQSRGERFPDNIGVVAVCPKGMGPSVRRLYEQGRSINGAGINSSFAVYQDKGNATDVALGWSIAIGSPVTFQTTLESEYKSDIFGERGILLGAVHGICEVLYRHMVRQGIGSEEAYLRVVEGITRPISLIISHEGIDALYTKFKGVEKAQFEKAYTAAYKPAMEILMEIYDDVAGGREIPSVIDHANRQHKSFPFASIDTTDVWRVAESVRSKGIANVPLDPLVAGVYTATMVAQCDLLMAAGHAYSEVANESVIEAVDSLNPYMRFKGVSYMVDNCSTTARLGSRKWAPRFDYILDQQTLPRIMADNITGDEIERAMCDFKSNKIHEILRVCSSMRPSVDIMPETTHLGVRGEEEMSEEDTFTKESDNSEDTRQLARRKKELLQIIKYLESSRSGRDRFSEDVFGRGRFTENRFSEDRFSENRFSEDRFSGVRGVEKILIAPIVITPAFAPPTASAPLTLPSLTLPPQALVRPALAAPALAAPALAAPALAPPAFVAPEFATSTLAALAALAGPALGSPALPTMGSPALPTMGSPALPTMGAYFVSPGVPGPTLETLSPQAIGYTVGGQTYLPYNGPAATSYLAPATNSYIPPPVMGPYFAPDLPSTERYDYLSAGGVSPYTGVRYVPVH